MAQEQMAPKRWRDPLTLKARSAAEGSVEVVSDARGGLPQATSIALHDTEPFLVTGSTQRKNGFQVMEIVNDTVSYSFRQCVKGRANTSIFDVTWQGTELMTACADGVVSLYEADPNEADSLSLIEKSKYNHSKGAKQDRPPPAAPGRPPAVTRIARVRINALEPSLFLTVEGAALHVWAFSKTELPLSSEKVSKLPNLCAEWSPHNPHLMMASGASKSLKVLDTRLLGGVKEGRPTPVIWKVEDAHQSSILDLKWSPFVNHWVATCSNDALVKVWDLRRPAGPVAILAGHTDAVNSVDWSRSHADTLMSGGSDRCVTLWNLRLAPHCVLHKAEVASTSIVGVCATTQRPSACIATSAAGELISVTPSDPFLMDLAPTRLTQPDERVRAIEQLVYMRDFATAFPEITELASELQSSGKVAEARRILELCTPRQAPPDWSVPRKPGDSPQIGSASARPAPAGPRLSMTVEPAHASTARNTPPTARSISGAQTVPAPLVLGGTGATTASTTGQPETTYEDDVNNYSYYIPPKFPPQMASQADRGARETASIVTTQARMLTAVEEHKGLEAGLLLRESIAVLKTNIEALEASVVKRAVECYASASYVGALETALEIGQVYADEDAFAFFTATAKWILQPTIYDSDPSAATPRSKFKPGGAADNKTTLDSMLRNPAVCLPQITLLKDIMTIVSQPGAPSKLAARMAKEAAGSVFSLPIIRLWFNALQRARRYGQLYSAVAEMHHAIRGTPGEAQIMQILKEFITPQFEAYLTETSKSADPDALSIGVLATVDTARAFGESRLPAELGFLPTMLSTLSNQLEAVLEATARGKDGEADARALAEDLIADINKSTKERRVRTSVEAELTNVLEMLDSFL